MDLRSNQAGATCIGVALSLEATSESVPDCTAQRVNITYSDAESDRHIAVMLTGAGVCRSAMRRPRAILERRFER